MASREMQEVIDEMFSSLSAPVGPVRFADGATAREAVEMRIDTLIPTLHLRRSAALLAQRDILLIGGWDEADPSEFKEVLGAP